MPGFRPGGGTVPAGEASTIVTPVATVTVTGRPALVAPYLIFAALWVAAALVPTFAGGLLFNWTADLIAIVALLGTARLAACFVLLSFVVGWAMGGLLRAEPRERFTLAMEFATRNVAIATAVAVTLLGRIEFAVFATTYFLTELPLALLAVTVFRRGQARAAARGVVTA